MKTTPDLDRFDGKWVAIRGNKVVAHADDEETLRDHPAVRDGDDVYPIGHLVTGWYMINV